MKDKLIFWEIQKEIRKVFLIYREHFAVIRKVVKELGDHTFDFKESIECGENSIFVLDNIEFAYHKNDIDKFIIYNKNSELGKIINKVIKEYKPK
jgi:hypothetical protein